MPIIMFLLIRLNKSTERMQSYLILMHMHVHSYFTKEVILEYSRLFPSNCKIIIYIIFMQNGNETGVID